MFTVYYYDDGITDDVEVYSGTLEECREFVLENTNEFSEPFFIVDGETLDVIE